MGIRLIQHDKRVEIEVSMHEIFLVTEARKLRAELDAVIKEAEILQRPPLRKLGEF